MAQSLARILVHLVYSTKHRAKLLPYKPYSIDVVDGLLQIHPPHNQALCRALKKRTLELINAATALPAFRGATT